MRYPGCAAGGMRRVRRNAASKLNNGRCTSQISAMSSRRASGESRAISASRRRSSLSKAPRSTSPGRRNSVPCGSAVFARAPSPDAEILHHGLLVASASPRNLGNRERVFWPKRLEHAVIVTPCRSCANRASGRERSPISVTPFWRHRDQQTLMVLGPSPGGCARVGSPKDNGRRRRGQEQPFLPLADLCGGRTASPLLN
jgi:hypothetical protein